ncbi:MAG: hypothetical protein ACFHVJ_20240 [Aestuariibacter sp.]
MNSIFKKTLIAAAFASVGTANAATIGTADADTGTAGTQVQKISQEGYDALGYIMVGDTTTTNDITVTWTSGIAYNQTDTLTFTFTGATIANTSASGITLVETSTTGSDDTLNAIGIDTDAGTITFRATTAAAMEDGATYEMRGVRLTSVGSSVSVSSAGETTGGTAIDAGAAQAVATMSSQFSLAATSGVTLNRVIDVENSRKQFVTDGTDVINDSISYTLTNSADLLAVTVGAGTFSLTGSDLGFLNDEDGDLESTKYAVIGGTAASTGTGVPTLSDDTTTFGFTTTAAPAAAFGVTLTADGVADTDAQVLTAQEFEADVSYATTYTHNGTGFRATHGATPGTVSFSDLDAGEWTLSGANVNIEFMPYGTGLSQFIYVTNNGNVTGDIELTAIDNAGNTIGPVALGVSATAKTVTKLQDAIRTALDDAGANLSSGRFALTLTINSPSADIEVTAGYNSRGDRVLIK